MNPVAELAELFDHVFRVFTYVYDLRSVERCHALCHRQHDWHCFPGFLPSCKSWEVWLATGFVGGRRINVGCERKVGGGRALKGSATNS